ncbi:MAG: phosphatidate cytidylyltransferase [Anaerolineae bacterium]|nr:phosphatidate cytidylyltransferase [Anaerolineae bacterium]
MTSAPKSRNQRTQAFTLTNLQQRVLTALLLGPVVLLLVVLGGWWFFFLAVGLSVIAALEFANLGQHRNIHVSPLLSVVSVVAVITAASQHGDHLVVPLFILTFALTILWAFARRMTRRTALIEGLMTIAAPAYIGLPTALLVLIRNAPEGLLWLLLVLVLTWGTDIFAYFGGRLWGKTKLAPRISPKKTVEGALAGYLGGAGLGALLLGLNGQLEIATALIVLLGPVAAILGDLVESALKRAFNVKDSHLSQLNLFPGHGGVLDRTDSLILVACFCYFCFRLLGIV